MDMTPIRRAESLPVCHFAAAGIHEPIYRMFRANCDLFAPQHDAGEALLRRSVASARPSGPALQVTHVAVFCLVLPVWHDCFKQEFNKKVDFTIHLLRTILSIQNVFHQFFSEVCRMAIRGIRKVLPDG